MFHQVMLWDLTEPTSSQASPDGNTPSGLQDGLRVVPSGPEAAPASRSARPGTGRGKRTPATSGPSYDASSPSAVLQRSLESRLRASLGENGSPEYVLTWKNWDMLSGPPICAQRAWAPPTSGSGCSGWPTPAAHEFEIMDVDRMLARREELKAQGINGNGFGLTLGMTVGLVGWPTPNVPSGGRSPRDGAMSSTGMTADGQKRQVDLGQAARLAGWASPKASDSKYPSLQSRMDRDGLAKGEDLKYQASTIPGPDSTPSPAATARRGVLNPDFVRWLMGYPAGWVSSGASAMRSLPRWRPRS